MLSTSLRAGLVCGVVVGLVALAACRVGPDKALSLASGAVGQSDRFCAENGGYVRVSLAGKYETGLVIEGAAFTGYYASAGFNTVIPVRLKAGQCARVNIRNPGPARLDTHLHFLFDLPTYSPEEVGTPVGQSGPPKSPPAAICGNTTLLRGPSAPPAGAITVPAGNNSGVSFGQVGKTYWFAPGTHTLGTDQYAQIIPANNSTFIGGPGAILDGQNRNNFAFTQRAIGVKIKYLTIQGFTTGDPAGNGSDQGVVNHDSGHNWTIQYNTIQNNHGAGVMIGTGNVLSYNCIRNNGQYGFNAYEPAGTDLGPANILMDHNEIVGNDADHIENKPSANGNFGGGKFWQTVDATVTNNYVHGNHFTGLWFDSDNVGARIEGNYISDNDGIGLWYEVSYNALIKNNAFLRNDFVKGPGNDGFVEGAIYLSESGGDSRITRGSRRYSTLEITGNVFTDNWNGISVWESADRFCGNGETGYCTIVNPAVKINTCTPANINKAPYFNDCRWKAQNISIHHNTFNTNPANIGHGCATARTCGQQAIFSNYGTYPSWSPYKEFFISDQMVSSRNIHFANNTYNGPWKFMIHDQGQIVPRTTWQGAQYKQDAGSTFH